MGAPTTSMGVYSLTYPITYLSYFFSRFILRHELWTLEVYSILHIFAGYFSFYWAARCYRVRAALATLAALCTVLCGWLLIAAASWFYVSPIFVYVPLMIVAVAKLEKSNVGWKWVVALAIVIGLFFHAGNVQFWVYGMMFLWITLFILKWSGQIDWSKMFYATAATLLGVALVCPLLIPQFLQTRDSVRVMSPETGQVVRQWQAVLLPGPWVNASSPANSIEPAWKTGGLIVYSGTTFSLFFILLLTCFVFYRFDRKAIGQNTWTVGAVIAWFASMGLGGIVWPIMVRLPLLSKFRIPMKFLGFFDIFTVLIGAVVLQRIMLRVRRQQLIVGGIAVLTASLLVAVCLMPLPTWYTYPIKPYPMAQSVLEHIPNATTRQQRILSLALMRSSSPDYWQEIPHNLPTIYQVPALLGYDPLVGLSATFRKVDENLKTHLLRSCQEYGVEYVFLPNDFDNPRLSGTAWYAPMEKYPPVPRSEVPPVVAAATVLFHNDELSILHVPDAKPLAFAENAPATSLPVKLGTNGFDVDVASVAGTRVIANFLWYPEMRAELDGQVINTRADSWQRIAIDVPTGARKVQVRFVSEWRKGFLCAMLAALAAIACGFLALRFKGSGAAATTASP